MIALRVVLELDGEETARVLGISPTAVSTRLHRALGKLEERMRHHDPVDARRLEVVEQRRAWSTSSVSVSATSP